MLLYIIRHGDPIYNPDSLTPKGLRQAEAIGKRIAVFGLDEIYASPLNRARLTAQPASEMIKKDIQTEEWMSESLAWQDFVDREHSEGHTWVWFKHRNEMKTREIRKHGDKWYDADVFKFTHAKEGYERILAASDEFFLKLGYEHDRENYRYIAKNHNEKRIAAFCHEGFGLSWIGTLLDIPLPEIWSTFSISHSCMTVINFVPDENGIVFPKVLTHSNDSHLYKEGLPLDYQNGIRI